MFLQGAITFACDFIQYRKPQGRLPSRIFNPGIDRRQGAP
jgi:hypothetical protein